MRIVASLFLGAVLLFGFGWTHEASAQSCEARAEGSVPDYTSGTRNPIICNTHGAQQFQLVTPSGVPVFSDDTSTTGGVTVAVAHAAAPTWIESQLAKLWVDLQGLLHISVDLFNVLLAGEDLTNNLIMTSGGAVRGTVGNIASAVTTDITSTAVQLPTGSKTIYGSVDGTGAVTQTQKIYGGLTSGVTATTGELLCTLTLSGTTHAHAVCAPITANFLYYIMVSSATTGTGASGNVTAMY